MTKYIRFSTEDNFKSFMKMYKSFEDLDDIKDDIPPGVKIADYAIRNLVVMELKTIKSDPKDKLEDFFHELSLRPDFPSIYGKLDFRKTVNLMDDSEEIIRKFENKAFRQIEGVVRSANKQIKSTIDYLSMNESTCGTLVLINESVDLFEPDILSDYICKLICSKSKGLPRFQYINRIILLQDSHKLEGVKNHTFVPINEIVNDSIGRSTIENKLEESLDLLIKNYSHFNGYNHKKIEGNLYGKLEPIKQSIPVDLTVQEKLEEHYRNNRYMKNYTDEELISFGSLVMSTNLAMFMKKNPLKVEHQEKMHIVRTVIELFEESRIRPFDLKKLDVDPYKIIGKPST